MENPGLERVALLMGEAAVEKLQNTTVLVAGVGGVGSYAAEALARTGVGKLILVDKDTVSVSNLNRQIMAEQDTVDVGKCEAMKARIHRYNPYCEVICREEFISAENASMVQDADYVIDAIDTVTSKLALIEECHKYGVGIVCSLGMGNRLDPSQIYVTDLWKTQGDPLARSVRSQARKRGIDYPVKVMMSAETPRRQNTVVDPDGKTRKDRIPPASAIFVPAAAGLLAASTAVRDILGGLLDE